MKELLAAATFAFALSAQAVPVVGFTGDYAPGNWLQTPGDGSVNVFDATGLSLTSGNLGSPSFTDVSIVVAGPPPTSVTISFDWFFSTQDDAFWEIFGHKSSPALTFSDISDSFGGQQQSGSFSIQLDAGDTFAFSLWSVDGSTEPSTVRISNFRVDAVPEPGTLVLLAAGLAAGFGMRRRQAA